MFKNPQNRDTPGNMGTDVNPTIAGPPETFAQVLHPLRNSCPPDARWHTVHGGSFTPCTPVNHTRYYYNILRSPSPLPILFSMHDTRNVLPSSRHVSRCFRYSLHCYKLIVRCYQPAVATVQPNRAHFARITGMVRASWLYENKNQNFS